LQQITMVSCSQNLPEDDTNKDGLEESFSQECQDILAAIPQPLSLKLRTKSKPFGQGTLGIESVSLDALIKMSSQHQTRHAALAVRTQDSQNNVTASAGGSERQKEESIRHQILREMHAILKEQQGQGAGTGKERAARWQHKTESGKEANTLAAEATGNSANAAVVASQTAKKVC
jgi:hypothetical protein